MNILQMAIFFQIHNKLTNIEFFAFQVKFNRYLQDNSPGKAQALANQFIEDTK